MRFIESVKAKCTSCTCITESHYVISAHFSYNCGKLLIKFINSTSYTCIYWGDIHATVCVLTKVPEYTHTS